MTKGVIIRKEDGHKRTRREKVRKRRRRKARSRPIDLI